jgi:outer membrane protein OmpA-like peptidoglycan-associated protein
MLFSSRSSHTISSDESHWLSVSDLMAGLMMVFLFISIALLRNVIEDRDKAVEQRNKLEEIAQVYQQIRINLYDQLYREFQTDLPRWSAEIDKNTLSFRFNSPDVLFKSGDVDLQPKFIEILNDFYPRYLKILLQFKSEITAVRIEGHTSSEWGINTPEDIAYFRNMALSQGRTRSVLEYLYHQTNPDHLLWVKKHLAAVGYSSSHPIYISESSTVEDRERSRRVVFRVITDADTKIQEILQQTGLR